MALRLTKLRKEVSTLVKDEIVFNRQVNHEVKRSVSQSNVCRDNKQATSQSVSSMARLVNHLKEAKARKRIQKNIQNISTVIRFSVSLPRHEERYTYTYGFVHMLARFRKNYGEEKKISKFF